MKTKQQQLVAIDAELASLHKAAEKLVIRFMAWELQTVVWAHEGGVHSPRRAVLATFLSVQSLLTHFQLHLK